MSGIITQETINSHMQELLEPNEGIEAIEGLEARVIDLSKNYPDLSYLFERNGQACFPKGDFQTVKGKAKSGKSTFMIGLLSTLLGTDYLGFKAIKSGCISMYIDTEQNPINTANLVKKVHTICGLPLERNDERFIALNLRGDDPSERKDFIREAIEKYKPDFIIIDGIKDLIIGGDINSEAESNKTVQFLLTITKEFNVAILTVIHENKNDENMRGHLGSELFNRGSEVWQIKKSDDLFQVEQIENRNDLSRRINFGFKFDEERLPVLVDTGPTLNPAEKLYQKKIETFYFCLQPGIKRTYTDLKKQYCEAYGCKEGTAEKDIATFLKNRYLLKDEVSKEYRFNPFKVPKINVNSTSDPPP